MQIITNFTEHDVLCGRGGGTLRHAGNKKYRSLIKSSKPVYLISSKNEKTAISRSIVAATRNQNGRFLERSKDLQSWYDIGDAKATEKTSQALREGQPKLRKRMIDNGIITNDLQSFSNEGMISLLPASSSVEIESNPICVGDDSYTSVKQKDTRKDEIEQQRSTLEQSLNRMTDNTIDNGLFHSTVMPENTNSFHFGRNESKVVTPPTTPPNYPQAPIERIEFDNDVFLCPFPNGNQNMGDYDDSSIMTFDMDDDEMIDSDIDNSLHSYQRIFPISTPSPPMTNHFRALNELKNNVQIFDNDGDQHMFDERAAATFTSPISHHLRALTELKVQVQRFPSNGGNSNNDCRDHLLNNSCQFNGNVSRNNLNSSCSAMGYSQNLAFPAQINF